MSDTPPPVPPLPSRPAAEAAAAAPAYDPSTDPDDTGVPTSLHGEIDDIGRGFFRALFDISFRTFITRRLASVFYLVGLIAIGIGFIVWFVSGIFRGIGALWINPGAGISLIIATIILVPILSFLAIITLRFVIEGIVALIAIAENTERTAENTRR
ncbi:hypothetical protein GCM10009775_28460 [Microbacterium aoyamense]|uniref:DUF4282 domain-containing protein n=1 Tax=Microbacterium aoyamense TaxID=344166 RepID=A0ABN2PW19_9MICO|nr:DUF4282 domain-containing protein [Microbacterium aoyamense]